MVSHVESIIKNNHFIYIEAGDPLDDPMSALPYMGPKWYWRENAFAIWKGGKSKHGNIPARAFLYVLKASKSVPQRRSVTATIA